MDKILSRRTVLKGSAVTFGAAMMGLSPLLNAAQLVSASASNSLSNPMNDIEVLNYALTLEHLEYAFYRDGLKRFTRQALGVMGGQWEQFYGYIELIRDHERTHVDALTSVIQSLGGTPVPELEYDFGYSDARGFAQVAQALENTGVMAYDGAVALIQSKQILTTAATIATVEARHASFLNLINGDIPFPAAFDTPKTPAEILAIAGQFIVS